MACLSYFPHFSHLDMSFKALAKMRDRRTRYFELSSNLTIMFLVMNKHSFYIVLCIVLIVVFIPSKETFFAAYNQPQPLKAQSLERIKLTQETQQLEVGMLKERAHNLEVSIESIQKDLSDVLFSLKENAKKSNRDLEVRLSKIEEKFEKSLLDVKTLKNHINDTSSLLSDTQKKLYDIQQTVKLQNEEIHELGSAMKNFAKLLGAKNAGDVEAYRVEAGDSLEKIAKKFGVSVQAIKDVNELKKNLIIPGQSLKIPQ